MELLIKIGLTATLLMVITASLMQFELRRGEPLFPSWFHWVLVISCVGAILAVVGCVFAFIWI